MYDAKSLILFCVLILAINCGSLICTSRHQCQESVVNCHLRCCSWPNAMIILYSTVLSTFAEWEDRQCPAISYDVILNYFVHLLGNTGTTALLSCISIFTVLRNHSPRGWKFNGVFSSSRRAWVGKVLHIFLIILRKHYEFLQKRSQLCSTTQSSCLNTFSFQLLG